METERLCLWEPNEGKLEGGALGPRRISYVLYFTLLMAGTLTVCH